MMRRMIAVAGMLVVMAGISGAQGGPPTGGMEGGRGGRGGMQRMEEMMFKGITLTADQKSKIDAVQAQQRKDMQAIDRKAPDSREKMGGIRDKSMAAIKAVLTPEQQKAYDANRDEMQKNMQKRQRPPAE